MLQGVLNFVLYDSMKEVDSFLLIKEIKTRGGCRPADRGGEGGGGASRPGDKGVVRSQKTFFRPFEPQFGLRIRGRGGGGGGNAPGPHPGIRHLKQTIHCLC